jgi:hypothetical protein
MNKQNVFYGTKRMEYYSAIKRMIVIIHVIAWKNLKNSTVSERSQMQKLHVECLEKANL